MSALVKPNPPEAIAMKNPTLVKKQTLHDLSGGLLYDEVLDLTWLQDASYVQTSGFKESGTLSWKNAKEWAKSLVYFDPVRRKEIKGWRLPRVRPVMGTWNGRFSLDGSTDEGYNQCGPFSELGHMFYENLGLMGYYAPDGSDQSQNCGATGDGQHGALADVGPVRRLASCIYWTETVAEPYVGRNAWMFDAQFGFQNFYNQNDMLCAWAVHDGNVTGVKPPAQVPYRKPKISIIPKAPGEISKITSLGTYSEYLAGVRCEFPFNPQIKPGPYWKSWGAMEIFTRTPDLVGFWTFGERAGGDRRSILYGFPCPMAEMMGPIDRVAGGPFSNFSAAMNGSQSFLLSPENMGPTGRLFEKNPSTLVVAFRKGPLAKWTTRCFCSNGSETWGFEGGRPVPGLVLGDFIKNGRHGEVVFGLGFRGHVGGLALFHRRLTEGEVYQLHTATEEVFTES